MRSEILVYHKDDRDRAIDEARKLLAEPELVILDTETTGLDSEAQICELAIIDRDGKVLVDTLLRPSVSIPEEASAIHGITDGDVEDALEVWVFVIGKLAKLLVPDRPIPIAIYNSPFDLRLLDQSSGQGRAWRERGDTFCIMDIYARFHGARSTPHGSYTWQSLQNAAHQCGLEWSGESHRALADARMALSVLRYVASAG